MVSRIDNQAVYTDLAGLNSISRLGRENTPEAMRQVAQQFESIFMNIMLKAMRDSNAVFAEGNYLQSNEMEFHQQNLDNQLSLSLSQGRGLGLADVLFEQMMGQYGEKPRTSGLEKPEFQLERAAQQGIALHPVRELQPPVQPPVQALVQPLVQPPVQPSVPALQRQTPTAGAQRVLQELGISTPATAALQTPPPSRPIRSPEDFVKTLYPIAEKVADSIGVDPRVLLAQSALETGWGRRMIAQPDGSNSHNLFGIKADARWQGDTATAKTLEYREGVAATETASFRSYDSYEESFRDYVQFLQQNPRYQDALGNTHDAQSFAHKLQHAGYATDPIYAKKVTGVMNSKTMQLALAQLRNETR